MRVHAAFHAMLLPVALALAAPSFAQDPHDRDGWWWGLGFGPTRGAVWTAEDDELDVWDTGSSPQIRLGRNLGRYLGLGVEAQTWFSEFGTAGEGLPLQLKIRATGHLWALAGSWFPGAANGPWGGLYVRAGAGPAIANYAAVIPDPSDPTNAREIQARIDNWGWGAVLAVGYEFRLSRHLAAGAQLSANHLWIGDDIDRIAYGGPVLQLNWYF